MQSLKYSMSTVWTVCLLLTALPCRAAERPNILWITAEDMSPTLGCYGDSCATTPNLDRFAKDSVRYTHAFATSPVCSPSRNCLITGCYPTTLGTHNMRSAFPLPDFVRGFPAYLRDAGYFTSNNEKTDYNTAAADRLIRESWDRNGSNAHWRNRPDSDQPFFSVFNLMVSHQSRSMVWPREQFEREVQSQLAADEIHDPAETPLPPYYPDTPVMRRDVARFYDCVTVMDKQVGALLQQLEEDGLADDTIVFFYSDHGSGMPRHKRILLDSGLHVPLLIRFPEKYSAMAPADPGTTTDRLVSFVDFPPTVLAIVGIDAPGYMQGVAFVNQQRPGERDLAFAHRDRIDEAFDVARALRSQRYLYVRNFMPHLSHNQPSAWPDAGELDEVFRDTTDVSEAVRQFTAPSRPVEELYDCLEDPHNLNNLADSSSRMHQKVLRDMRRALLLQTLNLGDYAAVPEAILFSRANEFPVLQGDEERGHGITAETEAMLQVGTSSADEFRSLLTDRNPGVVYWGCIALCGVDSLSAETRATVSALLDHSSPTVRIAAGDVLLRHGDAETAVPRLIRELDNDDLNVVLHAMRTIELAGSAAAEARTAVAALQQRVAENAPASGQAVFDQAGEADLRMFIGFSASAFLDAVAAE